jgi:choline-glycine betaine transporter
VPRNYWTTTTTDPWAKEWTIFYWANWFAWAPISVAFLGRIAYGHSVRAFLTINFLLPAAFTGFWMVVFAGSAIHMELIEGVPLIQTLNDRGPEGVLFTFLEHFPLAAVLIPTFLITAFFSFVTAADSNTSAMSGLSSTGISPESPEPSMPIKIVWGVLIGMVAWVMITFAHLDGIRMLSNLGGLPALFLCIGSTVCVILVAINPMRYDTFKSGYDHAGKPLVFRATEPCVSARGSRCIAWFRLCRAVSTGPLRVPE